MLARYARRPALALLGTVALVIALGSPAAAPPGDLDPTFDSDGRVTTDFAGDDEAVAVAIQGDGKIVAAGSRGFDDFALARYNPDGSLDPTFDGDGKVTTDFAGRSDEAFAVAIQDDGKIVAAGYAFLSETRFDFALARYNPDGSLDSTFDGDGKVTTDFNSDDQAWAVAIQGDGKIVAAGSNFDDFALARYNPDGSLDPTFDGDGKVTTDFAGGPDEAYAVAIQGDGKIVAAGTAVETVYGFALARYNPDGSLDSTFDGDGKVTTYVGGDYGQARGVAIQGDGKIVAAGSEEFGSFLLARYNPDGSLDSTFDGDYGDGDGIVETYFGTFTNRSGQAAFAVAIQGDGKIVAAGRVQFVAGGQLLPFEFALARYNPDGSHDSTFDGDGKVTTDFAGGSDEAFAVAIQGDGKIVAAGRAVVSGTGDFALARYRANYEADLSITKTGPPGRVPTGRNMTYLISVGNNGPDGAAEVNMTDNLPPSTSFVSASASQGACTERPAPPASGPVVTCALGSIAFEAAATVEIVVKPNTPGLITNTASVNSTTSDPNETNNSDSVNTSVCRITSRRSSIPCG